MKQHPIIAITIARLREFIRRPESVFWVYFFPVLMIIVLGTAFQNKAVERIDVDVLAGPQAEQIVRMLEASNPTEAGSASESSGASGQPLIVPLIVDMETSRDRLRTSKTAVAISSTDGTLKSLEYRLDAARPGSLAARDLVDRRLQTALGREDVIQSRDVSLDEPGSNYVDFLVPGLLAMGLMGGGLWGVGFAIVDMRIRKLLKRFMATPMKRTHFLGGMMCSRLVFMIPQIVILLLCSYLLFGVVVRGNWLAILLVVFVGAIQFSAIGLLVASRAQTLETVSGLMNLLMLPMWTLSGIFFAYERFPEYLHLPIKLLPLTPVIDALRGMMMDGKAITEFVPELGVMLFWCIAPFALAMAIFRWND